MLLLTTIMKFYMGSPAAQLGSCINLKRQVQGQSYLQPPESSAAEHL